MFASKVAASFAAAVLLLLNCSDVQAARVTVSKITKDPSTDEVEKTTLITLADDIEKGDAEKFVSIVEPYLNRVYNETNVRGNVVLRLNSEGGHYYDAIDIAEFVFNWSITTLFRGERNVYLLARSFSWLAIGNSATCLA